MKSLELHVLQLCSVHENLGRVGERDGIAELESLREVFFIADTELQV